MKKFIIERELPGAGNLTAEELQAISKTSVSVISVLGKPYKWVESYVTQNKIYCVHEAESEDVIREHSNCADFPVNGIEEIKVIINPATAG
ncbi:DUF4242 domain-containing protein [Ilyomonas limi]|jgi:hypothetical protein|uniref:DUF4242 domain-containing protein n=1 Tax=Ilyomonas limi TaxID=2575867 RepID=A0A4U3L389_9BACT|nr:DUF4242 domain-containing protein [Ilyomonas limi]TKK68007.1 DUF4242 domain-containing protein [Ilyomonas limi]